MHHGQLHIDAGLVRRLIREQFPGWADEQVTPLSTDATVNAIFRLGAGITARFPLREMDPVEAEAELRAEAAAMSELGDCCPVPTPRPVAIGRPAHGFPMPWSVQTWLSGEVATPRGLSTSQTFAADLAGLVSAFRDRDTAGRVFSGRGRGGHLADHDAWMSTCFDKSEGLLDVAELRSLWARFRKLLPSGPEVMSHGDLTPANLLVRGERLVGVLDGGGFAPADPALDLVAGWHLLDQEARERFGTVLNCDDLQWRRGAAWAFVQAMGLVWYYRSSNPGMSALGRSTLDRLLADPHLDR